MIISNFLYIKPSQFGEYKFNHRNVLILMKMKKKNQETSSRGYQLSSTELLLCNLQKQRSTATDQQNDLQQTAGAHSGCGKNSSRLARWTDGL